MTRKESRVPPSRKFPPHSPIPPEHYPRIGSHTSVSSSHANHTSYSRTTSMDAKNPVQSREILGLSEGQKESDVRDKMMFHIRGISGGVTRSEGRIVRPPSTLGLTPAVRGAVGVGKAPNSEVGE
eukprot:1207374-Amorphochlora_amoeboformis.AAC.1